MKISYSFYSLKDISHLSNGERLLDILLSNGFVVEKADDHEPIRKDFIKNDLPELWKGRGIVGGCSWCSFLFKGKKEVKFSGMVTWNVNLHPNNQVFNGIHLWLSTPSKYNFSNLMKLGDDIFEWSEAVYGYITEDSKEPSKELFGNVYDGLPGLLWVNYFGTPYTTETDFHLPDSSELAGHGKRLVLSERPDDERLTDSDFIDNTKYKIGVEWFWSHPRRYQKRIPVFDNSAITKK